MKCDQCKNESKNFRLRYKEGKWICSSCLDVSYIVVFTPIGTRNINGYGNVSVKRLDEIRRRKILPYEKVETKKVNGKTYISKGYYLGRSGENGKTQEKSPNYYR